MAENLIFRKGLQASLATLPIKPGAISITIDEPGMYVDLPANTALGHSDAYRVRIGDVITVQTLGDLANLKLDALTPENLSDDGGKTSLKGRINEYSSSALYYVTGQNMLLKYNVATGKFIWINDTTALQEQITALGSTVSGHSTRIGELETKVGAAKNGNVAATGLYKEIEDVKTDLEEQIAGILGGGNGLTLESVDAAIKQEAKDRAAADTALDGKITGLGGRLDTAETDIDNIEKLIGAADSTNVSEVFGKINKEIADREAADTALSGRIKAIEDLEIDGTYAKQEDLTGLTTTVGNLSTTVTDLNTTVGNNKTAAENAIKAEKERAEGIESGLNTRLQTIEGYNISTTYATKEEVTTLTTGTVNPLVTLVGAKTDDKTKETAFGYIAKEAARAEAAEQELDNRLDLIEAIGIEDNYATKTELNTLKNGAVKTNTNNISTLTNNLANNYFKKTETYSAGDLDTKFDNITKAETGAIAVAEKAAKDYAKGLDDQVRVDYAAADSALDAKIATITKSLEGYVTDGELESTVNTLNQSIQTAQGNAETNATKAAKSYTDAEIDKVEKAFADADEELDGKISTLTQSVYAKTETYNQSEVNAKIKAVTDVTGTYQAAWEKYADDKVKAEAEARDEAINGEEGVATKLAAHILAAEQTYETKANVAKAFEDLDVELTQTLTKLQEDIEKNANDYTDEREVEIRKGFAAEDLKLSQSISNIVNNTIPTLATKADTYTKKEVDDKDAATLQSAKDYVAGLLRAAEAMRYMGSLTSADPLAEVLAKTGVEAGDVWVVSQISTDGTYKPGDMFIAKADGATTAAQWDHVKTGYDANLEQKLFTEVNSDSNGGKITLDSIGVLDTGSIEIKADLNSAVRVTMTKDSDTSGNHGVATIGMVWEDF